MALLVALSIMMKKIASSKKHLQLKTRLQKQDLIYDKTAKKNTKLLIWGRTYLASSYKGEVWHKFA